MGTCYRKQNLLLSENSDNIILFEVGRRYTDIENMLSNDALSKLIKIKETGDTEDVMAIDDLINQIYGDKGDDVVKSNGY
jgi:hypothetical protein